MSWNLAARRRSRHHTLSNLVHWKISSKTTNAYAETCCGPRSDTASLNDGIDLFVQRICKEMIKYEATTREVLNSLLVKRSVEGYLSLQLELSTAIITFLKSMTPQTTTDDLVDKVFRQFKIDTTSGEPYKNIMRHFVFATIGWSTLLYTADMGPTSSDFAISGDTLRTKPSRKGSLEQSSQRPVGALLRSFGVMPITCPPGTDRSDGQPTLLAVTHLNFFSLSKLGDVTLLWTDDLSKHCEFDRYSREKTLKLFRWPSVCARVCLSKDEATLIDLLYKSHLCQHGCRNGNGMVAKAYLSEVLLSYRLLFGQHFPSRQLYRRKERKGAKFEGSIDPLLDTLCGDKDINDFDGTKALIRERGVYNARINFPHLGARLLELENYSINQRPRNLSEVWNDERDPERLLTFRAVLVVGALSILLSFVQVLVGIAQIVMSSRSR
ncbi:hypothetical protein EJ05DRAFT_480299 [Pseudovirgaria hyperparasitica]|uniref:Uncharacterized protein n=1 Tax=Pseudovirgaria hyperparasitica TaxID=470096 RepID=A0A6A6VRF7_9PEZI|nr:uncharacterized protein EJ05DRAFT_480299 [Pseudovirgaria hyperparasitica]KAF2753268.1 hypothetical protein EJ05DRAFT_480299 [Pseudovirgaria hyperparasitica]